MRFILLRDKTLINLEQLVAVIHSRPEEGEDSYSVRYNFHDGSFSEEEFKTSEEMMERFYEITRYLLSNSL